MRTVYLDGEFVPESEAKLSIYDLSVMQSAAAFTMTRSFGKVHFKIPDHLARLRQSCALLSIPLPEEFDALPTIIEKLTRLNAPAFQPDDEYRMLWVVSPGAAPMYRDIPGTIPHPWMYGTIFPLRFTVQGFGRYFTDGVSAVTSDIRQIPDACIPSRAKHRARLAFHLAQHRAPAGTWPLLREETDLYTEAPGANIVYVKDGEVCVQTKDCLQGISMQTVRELTHAEDDYTDLSYALHSVDELWLSGTPFCLLPVVSLDGKPIGDGTIGPVYRATLKKWSKLVNCDISGQICQWDKEHADATKNQRRTHELAAVSPTSS